MRELDEALAAGSNFIGAEVRDLAEQVRQRAVAALRMSRTTRSARAPPSAKQTKRDSINASEVARIKVPAAIPVRFGASAPSAVKPGARFATHFVAYPDGAADMARRLLNGKGVAEFGNAVIAHGTAVDVVISGEGLLVEGSRSASERFLWTGSPILVGFEVSVTGVEAPGSTVPRYDVMVDGIVLSGYAWS